MSKITVIGAGHVGLVTGACFADLGNEVVCVDIDEMKVALLNQGGMPIYEPGLQELTSRNHRAGRLTFTTSYMKGLIEADFVFVAVDTPEGPDGEADMRSVRRAAESIGANLSRYTIVVNKSTMPVGAGDKVTEIIRGTDPQYGFDVASNPEFLREGQAVRDFMEPDRIVIGANDRATAEQVATLYSSFKCPVIITDLRTAEMIKYASNAFLATRISFINEIASICDTLGADVKEVARGMGLDNRIGLGYMEAGLGYGGSCFPKDVKALEYMAGINGLHPQLLRAVMDINRDQRRGVVQKLRQVLGYLEGRVVGVLGLSFKPNTDDIRESAALDVIHLLESEGATVKAYDPAAAENVKASFPHITLCDNPYSVAEGSDALVVATEWNEFKQLDMKRLLGLLRSPIIVDGRNIYDPVEMRNLGFVYCGVGRGNYVPSPSPAGRQGRPEPQMQQEDTAWISP